MALADSSAPAVATYGIAEVAEQFGLTAHALRCYEKIGLLDIAQHQSGYQENS